ncbi:MAG: aminoacyl-tRNA hydrolase [Candidatus Microsaccharimonas sp.]
MKIVFAQGNPDRKYEKTRHNTGFMVLDAIADEQKAFWKDIDKFNARIAELMINGDKVILVKPQSYYNDTGLVARQFMDYYKLDPSKDILVIHDELALPFGTIRVRGTGSDAGNNGIKSLNTHIGDGYPRIRIGIWNDLRDRMDDIDFVLGNFSMHESKVLRKHVIPHVKDLIDQYLDGSLEASSKTIDE